MKFYKNREAMYPDFMPAMVWAEVGVQRAFNAQAMLDARVLELHLIDAWQHYDEGDYTKDPANLRSQADQNFIFGEVLEKMRPYTETVRVQIHRLPSQAAAKLFTPGSLDGVFLDAAHDYANVYADLLSWEPALSERAVFMCHDYDTSPAAQKMGFGVFDAVNQFMDDRRWKPVAMSCEGWGTICITRR